MDRRLPWSLGVAFLGLAALSLLWSPQPLDGVGSLWHWTLIAGAFVVGSRGGAVPIYEGAAIGVAVNSAIAVVQLCGWHLVPSLGQAAGLFVNKDFLAEAALPVAVWLAWTKRWMLPFVLPALLLPQARAVTLIAVPLLLWPFSRIAALLSAGTLVAALGFAFTVVWPLDQSKNERLAIWQDTLRGVTVFGHGIGQFYGTYPEQAVSEDTETRRPSHAHSDYLEILYELGPIGLGLTVAFIMSLLAGGTGVWFYVFLAVALDAIVAFPFQNPASGVLAFLAAGSLCRERTPLRDWRYAGAIHAG